MSSFVITPELGREIRMLQRLRRLGRQGWLQRLSYTLPIKVPEA